MLVRRLLYILIPCLLLLGLYFFTTRNDDFFVQNGVYRLNLSEIQRLLQLSEPPEVNFVSSGVNTKSARFDWPDEPGSEMMSTWFKTQDNKLVLDFYLDEKYSSVLKEYPEDATRMINHAIILGYITSQLDAQKYNISSFCDQSCDITDFHIVESLK
jgi:hypothetical protein